MAQVVKVTANAAQLIEQYSSAIEDLARQRTAALRMLMQTLGVEGEGWRYEAGKLINDTPKPGDAMVAQAVRAREEGKIEQSYKLTRRAISAGVSDAVAYSNLASCLGMMGHLGDANAVCTEAISRFPDEHDMLRYERAFHRLRAGDWGGWEDWEFRQSRLGIVENMTKLLPGVPEWDGEHLDGTLMIVAEGGIGDTIMYARYMRQVMGFRVPSGAVVVCKSKTVAEVFANINGALALTNEPLPDVAAWIPMWSLAKHWAGIPPPPLPCFGHPREHGYSGKTRVGICWHGDKDAAAALYRPSDTDNWWPLFNIPNVEVISLQMGESWLAGQPPDIPNHFTLQQTADVIRDLDLVIACDGMIAHLAGTIGVPVWMPLHRYGYWPWEPSGETTVWYPSIRMFHEEQGWPHLFGKLAKMLQDMATSSAGACNRERTDYPATAGPDPASADQRG